MVETNEVFDFGVQSTDCGLMMSQKLMGYGLDSVSRNYYCTPKITVRLQNRSRVFFRFPSLKLRQTLDFFRLH